MAENALAGAIYPGQLLFTSFLWRVSMSQKPSLQQDVRSAAGSRTGDSRGSHQVKIFRRRITSGPSQSYLRLCSLRIVTAISMVFELRAGAIDVVGKRRTRLSRFLTLA